MTAPAFIDTHLDPNAFDFFASPASNPGATCGYCFGNNCGGVCADASYDGASFDYELLAAIDPLSLPSPGPAPRGRPQLTLLDGGLDDAAPGRVRTVRGGVPAVDRATRGESELIEVYRRRRFLAALALTVIVVAVAWASGLSLTSFGATPTATDEIPAVHVVGVGDTYPSIATELGADDPNEFAETLRAANGGAELAPGQRLVVNLDALG